nr:hypothetical protein [Haloechinothrix alba]
MNLRARSHLPVDLSTLIGRKDELRRCERLLSSARLLTLTGPGGVGKSGSHGSWRGVQRAFPDGVWLVELGDLQRRLHPFECGHSRETTQRWNLAGWAEYGCYASHSHFFKGIRLHLVATLGGCPSPSR